MKSRKLPDLILYDNKEINHRTKDEIKKRQGDVLHLGTLRGMEPPENIIKSKKALEVWEKIIDAVIDSGTDYLTNIDTELLEVYCLTCADLHDIQTAKLQLAEELASQSMNKIEIYKYIVATGMYREIERLSAVAMRALKSLCIDPITRLAGLKNGSITPKDNLGSQFGGL